MSREYIAGSKIPFRHLTSTRLAPFGIQVDKDSEGFLALSKGDSFLWAYKGDWRGLPLHGRWIR